MPLIKQDFIDTLIRDADIVQVFQQNGEEVKKKGTNFFCQSPFAEDKTASCWVQPKTQMFKDFSSGKSGNAIQYLMHKKSITYPEAIAELARSQGKTVEYEDSEYSEKQEKKLAKEKDLRKYLEGLQPKFQQELQNLPKDHAAWKEIAKRGYTEKEVKEWGIGYAPGNQFIYTLFSTVGNIEAGKKLGLINDKNQDKLWNRLVYPIYDDRNKLAGFASRQLDDNKDFAKWMNPSDNDLYRKDRIFYGLNFAKSAINKENRVWIVEGYNDVIGFHKFGIENTVAPCGTAVTENQIRMIKKLTSKVTLCMDGDIAGRKAISRLIPVLIAEGLSVTVCQLPEGADPDDYTRKYLTDNPNETLETILSDQLLEKSLQPFFIDGFSMMVLEKMDGDEADRVSGVREIAQTISKISDHALKHVYTERLTKESKMKPAIIKSLMQEHEAKNIKVLNSEYAEYIFPDKLTTKPEDLIPLVKTYQIFQSDNKIYAQSNFDEAPFHFKLISNFSIDIVQHMFDEKFPTKLIRICNVKNEERIFDTAANTLNTPQRFSDELSNQGNFIWDGDQKQLKKLTSFLFDQMGIGRKIEVLGWNPEGFYCWNNVAVIPGEKNIDIDKNGIFHYNGHTYYVPSANDIYRNNHNKYQAQKRISLKKAGVPMEEYLGQLLKVHGDFALVGMLFAFASAHQDIVVDVAQSFPIYFLYGPPSTGKDQLFACLKSMFGISTSDVINLENNQSTGKAKIRKFAEFANMMVHLSEFTNANKENDGLIKGLWDRTGYTRGTLDSAVSTETIPILSSALMTGNETPINEAVLTRIIYGEMQKNQFSAIEKEEFKKLNDMNHLGGLTEFMQKIIWLRPQFKEKFGDKFNMYKRMLSDRDSFKGGIDRLVTNYAVLGATFDIIREEIILPFGFTEMLETFDKFVENTRRKLESYSILARFWDVFIWAMRGNESMQLKVGRDLRLDGNILSFNYTNVFNRIQTEWYSRNHESAPAKMTLLDKIKKDDCFLKVESSFRLSEGAHGIKTSVIQVDINKIDASDNLIYAIEWQRNEQLGMDNLYDSPATPDKDKIEGNNTRDGLLF